MALYVVPVHSASGDDYLLGPFAHIPAHEEVFAVFRAYCEEEADYCEELGYTYRAYTLPSVGSPDVIDFQSVEGVLCVRVESSS